MSDEPAQEAAPKHASLWAALHAFQAEAPTLPKDATNPHFKSKFTPLDTIVERIQPLLTKHGLVWTASPAMGKENFTPILRYRITHIDSGDYHEDAMDLLLAKSDPQGQGSALTYARRYAMCAVLNLVADEDDDGNRPAAANREEQDARKALRQLVHSKQLTGPVLKPMFEKAGVEVAYGATVHSTIDRMSTDQCVSVMGQIGALGSEPQEPPQ